MRRQITNAEEYEKFTQMAERLVLKTCFVHKPRQLWEVERMGNIVSILTGRRVVENPTLSFSGLWDTVTISSAPPILPPGHTTHWPENQACIASSWILLDGQYIYACDWTSIFWQLSYEPRFLEWWLICLCATSPSSKKYGLQKYTYSI